MNVVDMFFLSHPRDKRRFPGRGLCYTWVRAGDINTSSFVTGNKKRLAWQRAQASFTLLRSSARVPTLPDLAPSLNIWGLPRDH